MKPLTTCLLRLLLLHHSRLWGRHAVPVHGRSGVVRSQDGVRILTWTAGRERISTPHGAIPLALLGREPLVWIGWEGRTRGRDWSLGLLLLEEGLLRALLLLKSLLLGLRLAKCDWLEGVVRVVGGGRGRRLVVLWLLLLLGNLLGERLLEGRVEGSRIRVVVHGPSEVEESNLSTRPGHSATGARRLVLHLLLSCGRNCVGVSVTGSRGRLTGSGR